MNRFHAVIVFALTLLSPAAASPELEGPPVFAGFWVDKDPSGVGALFYDMTWDGLVAHWKELGGRGQYLVDVEAYRRNGEWRFAATWRVGPGHGALLLAPWNDFLKTWNELKDTQELIDLEVIDDGGPRKFLGVWRRKPDPGPGTGALFVGLTWDDLVAKHRELGKSQYLASVAPYLEGGKRLFGAVWRLGAGNGGLYWYKDWADFLAQKRKLDATQEMLDFKMFQAHEGKWNFLGVWRVSSKGRALLASSSETAFKPLSAEQFVQQWEHRNARATLAGLAVVTPVTPLRGDTTCRYGDPDCNRCATDVAVQFRLAFEGGHRPWIGWHQGSWNFRGKDRYPPDGLQPEDAFRPFGEGKQVGVVSKHVQGFVRTNSDRFPYAGSHSHKDVGSIFVIENRGGGYALHALYESSTDHPSGVAVLGDGLFLAEKGKLRRLRISEAGKSQGSAEELDGLDTAGGGLGLAKLQDGRTLLIMSGPGDGFRKGNTDAQRDQNLKPRHTRFFVLDSPFAPLPKGLKPFFEWPHRLAERPDKPMAYSENMSVVTECESGRIFMIHTTGDYGLYGDGYWRLSRVDDGPLVTHVAIARQDQNTEKCHHRSAATVHVDRNGQLEFICTERAVIKWNPEGEFTFTEGRR
jgi:Bacterial tandem repeat domain 1